MNDIFVTITTTAVPMAGYEESVVGGEWITSRFRSVSEAVRLDRPPLTRDVTARQSTTHLNTRRLYFSVRPQTAVIDWETLLPHPERSQPQTTATELESAVRAFEEPVRRSFLAFFVATLKATATGDMTRPIILHWEGHGGGRTEISTGRWVIQLRDRVQRIRDALPPAHPVQTANAMASDEATDFVPTFHRLAKEWKEEKQFCSSMTAIEKSPHYLGVMALGRGVVPLLLEELKRDPDYWFTALQTLTGEDPVPKADRGDLLRMTEHWLSWGRRMGYTV
jgi:hypothetical protein